MSEARAPDDDDTSAVTITRDGEWYVARDEETDLASQGETRAKALVNLAEAIEIHAEPISGDVEADTPDAPWFE